MSSRLLPWGGLALLALSAAGLGASLAALPPAPDPVPRGDPETAGLETRLPRR